jgi:hypothetical protein
LILAGPGHTQELVDKYNMKNVFKLPISEQFSLSGDSGRCVTLFKAACLTSYEVTIASVVTQAFRAVWLVAR